MRRLLVLSAVLIVSSGCVTTRFPQDVAYGFKNDDMQKMSTPHAEIYYRAPSRKTAQHIAGRLEQCISLLRSQTISGREREKFQVMITSSNFNNANVAPRILGMEQRMLLPEQMSVEFFPLLSIGASEIGDIACHEAVHYVHLEETNGFWRLVNAVLGNVHQPNTFADTWFLEGLATHFEGNLRKRTGRPHNPLWRGMFESGVAKNSIDSGDLSPLNRRQLPVGGHYLIGQHFVEYLSAKHGERKLWEFVDVQGSAVFTPLWVTLRFKSVFGNSIGAEMDLYSEHLKQTLKLRERTAAQKILDPDIGYFGRLAVARDGTYAVWIGSRDEVATLRVYEKSGKLRLSKPMTQIFPGRDWLSSNVTSVSGLSFTEDGKQIGFVLADVTQLSNDHSRALVLDATTGELLRSSEPFIGTGGQLSVDGLRFLVVESHDATSDLSVLTFGEKKLKRLTTFNDFESISAPSWSPDEQRIAFSRWSGNGFHVFVREGDGKIRPVVTEGGFNYAPRFVDDDRLIFMRADSFRGQPYIAHVSTGAVERAVEVPYVALDPHLAADGRMLFLNRDGWDWTLDEVMVGPAKVTLAQASLGRSDRATDAAPITVPGDSLPPRSDALPPVKVLEDHPYSQADNAFYPGFRAPLIAPAISAPATGPARIGLFAFLGMMGADRLGLHNWGFQLQYSSFDRLPSVTAGYGTYLTAPWFTSVNAAFAETGGIRDISASVGTSRSYYTWPISFAFNYLDRDPVRQIDGTTFSGRAVGPSASISWSGIDSTPYTGGKRGVSMNGSVSYFPTAFGSVEEIADFRGAGGFYVPLFFARRQSLNFNGVGRVVPSEQGGLLRVGGTGVFGLMSRGDVSAPTRIGAHPGLSFTEDLRGYEDRATSADSVVIGNGRYRYTFVIDEGWASLLYLFPPYFIRQIDVEAFGSIARLNPDRRLNSSSPLLRAAGASVSYRSAIGIIPFSVVYQYAHRFDQGLGDLHFVALELN